MKTKTHFYKVSAIILETVDYMNRFTKCGGHVEVELASDFSEGEEFYIVDVLVHGYIEKKGVMSTRSRSFEYGYTNDKTIALAKAVEIHKEMKACLDGIQNGFEINDGIVDTEY